MSATSKKRRQWRFIKGLMAAGFIKLILISFTHQSLGPDAEYQKEKDDGDKVL